MKPRKCRACGAGTISLLAKAGRIEPYKGLQLELPANVAVPTCNNCGAEWMDAATAERIDAALETAFQAELRRRFDEALGVLLQHTTRARLERAMHLSQGYLSKRDKALTPRLVSHLMLLAREPKRVDEAEALWGEPAAAAPR